MRTFGVQINPADSSYLLLGTALLVGAYLFFTAVVLLALTICTGIRLVRRRPWSASRKKAVFAAFCALILFPVMIPTGTISAFPVPNIVLIALLLWAKNLDALVPLYVMFWQLILMGFAVTWLFFRGIAAFALFENPHKTGEG